VDLADAVAGEIFRHGIAPECHDDLRFDKFKLIFQPFAACLDLTGKRVTIIGRAALDHVGDIDLVALEPDHTDELVKVLACGTDKRTARLVFIKTGSFAYE